MLQFLVILHPQWSLSALCSCCGKWPNQSYLRRKASFSSQLKVQSTTSGHMTSSWSHDIYSQKRAKWTLVCSSPAPFSHSAYSPGSPRRKPSCLQLRWLLPRIIQPSQGNLPAAWRETCPQGDSRVQHAGNINHHNHHNHHSGFPEAWENGVYEDKGVIFNSLKRGRLQVGNIQNRRRASVPA